MKIFLSWSGEPSRRAAEGLRQYLPNMIQSLEPFMSKRDIASGTRWASELAKELNETAFGIVCLTPDNLEAPWLLFEAGALAKHVEEGRVCCLLLRNLRPAQVTGPLSQFQNRQFAKDDFWHLLGDLNRRLDRSLDPSNLQAIFDKWWPDLEKEVGLALTDPGLGAPVERKRDPSELLEELLVRVRSVERTLQQSKIQFGGTERKPFSSAIFEEIIEEVPDSVLPLLSEFLDNQGNPWLVHLSHLRDRYSTGDVEVLLSSGLVQEAARGLGGGVVLTLAPGAWYALKAHAYRAKLNT
jgi:hypothetical protein